MELIDTHAHLYFKDFNYDYNEVIKNAMKVGIKKFYLPSINSKTFSSILNIEHYYPGICFPMIGLHPCYVYPNTLSSELKFINISLSNHKFYGIGEIGIDLYQKKNFLKEQKKAFSYQIKLAKQFDLPIIIHCRNAFNEVFEILEQEKHSKLRGIFHCFTGNLNQANQAIHYGMKLGIGGIITYKNNIIEHFLNYISFNNIVLETDSPYLAPVPYRGKRNEPIFLLKILKKLSKIYNIEEKELAYITTKNSYEVFQ